jgi:hypothetical protein
MSWFSFIAFAVGMVKPGLVLRWEGELTRKRVAKYYLIGWLVFGFFAMVFNNENPEAKQVDIQQSKVTVVSKVAAGAPLTEMDFYYRGLKLGDNVSKLKKMFGEPYSIDSPYWLYTFGDIQISNETVTGIVSGDSVIPNIRGIKCQDPIQKALEAYGNKYKKTDTGKGLVHYDYYFINDQKEKYVLRIDEVAGKVLAIIMENETVNGN